MWAALFGIVFWTKINYVLRNNSLFSNFHHIRRERIPFWNSSWIDISTFSLLHCKENFWCLNYCTDPFYFSLRIPLLLNHGQCKSSFWDSSGPYIKALTTHTQVQKRKQRIGANLLTCPFGVTHCSFSFQQHIIGLQRSWILTLYTWR